MSCINTEWCWTVDYIFVFIFASSTICVHGICYHSAWMYVTYSKKYIFVGRAWLTLVDVVAICCASFLWSKYASFIHVLRSASQSACGQLQYVRKVNTTHYRLALIVIGLTTLWVQKDGATLTMAITLSILDWFAKFFHCCREQ